MLSEPLKHIAFPCRPTDRIPRPFQDTWTTTTEGDTHKLGWHKMAEDALLLTSALPHWKLNSGLRHRNSVGTVSIYVAFHLKMVAIKRQRSIKLGKPNHISLAANLKRANPHKMWSDSNNVLQLDGVARCLCDVTARLEATGRLSGTSSPTVRLATTKLTPNKTH
jgi:hypothetical protein